MQRPQVDQLLPGMFQRATTRDPDHPDRPGTVVDAVLDVMAELHEPDEAILAGIDAVFDPYRTPDRFVPFLATWVDLDRLLPPDAATGRPVPFAPGYGRLRDLVATGAELAQWRGTSAGMRWFLQLATGVAGFVVSENVPGRPFHIEVQVPADAVVYLELIERIVAMEKPAFVTATVIPAPTPDPAAPPDAATTPGPGTPAPATTAATSDVGPAATAASHAEVPVDPGDLPTVAVPRVGPDRSAPGDHAAEADEAVESVEVVDAPTDAVPVAEPTDGPRWTGAGTESAWIPVSEPPPDDPPPAPEGANP